MNFAVSFLQEINDLSFSEALRSSRWLFPAVETLHVIAIVYVFGSIMRLDLRLMGFVWTDRPVTQIADEMLPYTWSAFVAAALFGTMMWMGKPLAYLETAFFDVKLIAMAFAFFNMLYFRSFMLKNIAEWNCDPVPPPAVRLAGALSLISWLVVLVCGRFVGFVDVF